MKGLIVLLLAVMPYVAGESCKFFDLFFPGFILLSGKESAQVHRIEFDEAGKRYTAKIQLSPETAGSETIDCSGHKNVILAVFDDEGRCVRWHPTTDVITANMGSDQVSKGRHDEAKIYLAKKSQHEYLTVISPRKSSRPSLTREVKLSSSHVFLNPSQKVEVFSIPMTDISGYHPNSFDEESGDSRHLYMYWTVRLLNFGGAVFMLYAAVWNGLLSKKTICGLNLFKFCTIIVSCVNIAHIFSFGLLFMLELRQSVAFVTTIASMGLTAVVAVVVLRSRDQMVFYKYIIPIYHLTGCLLFCSVLYFLHPVTLAATVIIYIFAFFYLPTASDRIRDTQEWRISISVAIQFYIAHFCMNGLSPPFSYFAVGWYGVKSAFITPVQSYLIFSFIPLLLPLTAGRYTIVRFRMDQQVMSLSTSNNEPLTANHDNGSDPLEGDSPDNDCSISHSKKDAHD